MTEAVPCPACGGSGFVVDPVAWAAEGRTARDRDQTANDEDQTGQITIRAPAIATNEARTRIRTLPTTTSQRAAIRSRIGGRRWRGSGRVEIGALCQTRATKRRRRGCRLRRIVIARRNFVIAAPTPAIDSLVLRRRGRTRRKSGRHPPSCRTRPRQSGGRSGEGSRRPVESGGRPEGGSPRAAEARPAGRQRVTPSSSPPPTT